MLPFKGFAWISQVFIATKNLITECCSSDVQFLSGLDTCESESYVMFTKAYQIADQKPSQ